LAAETREFLRKKEGVEGARGKGSFLPGNKKKKDYFLESPDFLLRRKERAA